MVVVSLGATAGLRAADEELVASLRRAGADALAVHAARPREVRTLALTDLVWARAARAAAIDAVELHSPGALVYSSSTAALLWPRRGAIRFDALAAGNRPGRHGLWQRSREARRLEQASVLVPWSRESFEDLRPPATPTVVVPMPVEPSGDQSEKRDVTAVTYAADARKKGLDRVIAAWRATSRGGEQLVIAGLSGEDEPGIRYAGVLPRDEYRALLRRARVFVTAPRREDYGIAQLEALADGCRVVTTPAPGPYAALPILRRLEPRYVSQDLAPALRAAIDDRIPDWSQRALAALEPFRHDAADRVVARELLPLLIP